MADAADIANDALDANLQAAIQRKLALTNTPRQGTRECMDCGFEIPKSRRAIAPFATTCIECQQVREAKQRHMRR